MKTKINIWSFIGSFICIILFFTATTSSELVHFVTNSVGFHPFTIVITVSLITFILGVIGFSGVHDWKGMIRSVSTVIITFGISVFSIIITLFGSMLS